jgi:hypothetical protein
VRETSRERSPPSDRPTNSDSDSDGDSMALVYLPEHVWSTRYGACASLKPQCVCMPRFPHGGRTARRPGLLHSVHHQVPRVRRLVRAVRTPGADRQAQLDGAAALQRVRQAALQVGVAASEQPSSAVTIPTVTLTFERVLLSAPPCSLRFKGGDRLPPLVRTRCDCGGLPSALIM